MTAEDAQVDMFTALEQRREDMRNIDAALDRMRVRIDGDPMQNRHYASLAEKRSHVAAGGPYTKCDVTKKLIRDVGRLIPSINKRADGKGMTDKAKKMQEAAE